MNPDRPSPRQNKATFGVALFFASRIWLSCLLVLLLVSGAWAETWRVRVDKVLDGDTVVLTGGERLRLRGIDAPEIRHGSSPGQFHGRESKAALAALVSNREILVDRAELDTDRYGRMVGTARLLDGRIVNLLLVEEGAAFVYPHPTDRDDALAERLLAAQRQAISRGEGFWPRILGLPQAASVYFGTQATKRFHAETCTIGRRIKRKNIVVFSSLREAFDTGFAPARECTPWPTARVAK